MRDLAARMGSLSKLTITVVLAAFMSACGGGGDSGLDGRESPASVGSIAAKGTRSCFPPPHGLTGWWPGDGNTDDTVGGRDALLRGNATTGAGLVDQAFILDGDGDFVEVPHDPALNFGTNDFTVALWVYFNNTDDEQVLIEKWIQRYPGNAIGWTLTKLPDNVLRLAMGTGADDETSVNSNVLSIPPGTWIHFAATRNGSHVTLFMNGAPVAESVMPILNLDSKSSLKFGHRGNVFDTPGSEEPRAVFLNGRIDEVEIFVGRALARGLIQAIFNAGSAGECKNAAALYSVTDLGSLGGNHSVGIGLNNKGQVTGISHLAGNVISRAFLYSDGTMRDLGTLYGDATNSGGWGINDKGQVAGRVAVAGGGLERAFIYSDGTMHDLGTLGGSYSFGRDINNKGQVTGYSTLAGEDGYPHAFFYSDGTMQDLGTLGGSYSKGYSINDKGQVVGVSPLVPGTTVEHAFLYSDGFMQDLGTLGGSVSAGFGINNKGQVTGGSITSGGARHAFLYTDGTMTDLGTLGGIQGDGLSVNDKGQVVGISFVAGNTVEHAFLYSDGIMYDLNDILGDSGAGWTLVEANHINRAGQIAGGGWLNGQYRAFLLTPLPNEKCDRRRHGNTGQHKAPGHHRDRHDQRPNGASWVQPEHQVSRCDAR